MLVIENNILPCTFAVSSNLLSDDELLEVNQGMLNLVVLLLVQDLRSLVFIVIVADAPRHVWVLQDHFVE